MTLRHMKIYVAVFHHSNITKAERNFILHSRRSVWQSKNWKNTTEFVCLNVWGAEFFPQRGAREFYGYALHIVSLFDEMEKKGSKLGCYR